MNDSDNRVIDIAPRLRHNRDYDGFDIAHERIRNLAFQATKLPNTLSKSDIEELGLAVLMHLRQNSRIV